MAASLEYVLSRIQRWTSPDLGELSDAVLLERFVRDGDESAFAALVSRHGGMVLRSCRRILGNIHDAEDAFQATFLILARKAYSLRQPAELPGWLHGVARRVSLKARAKATTRAEPKSLSEEPTDHRSDPLLRLSVRELLAVLDEEVARLPKVQRSAIVLCCLEGHSQEEAARLLGWTPGSLRGHLERGRHRLQARLLRRGIDLLAALAIVAVSRGEAVSALLLRNTFAAAVNGGISGSAAMLAQSVLHGMIVGKLGEVMGVILTAAFAASAAVALLSGFPTSNPPDDKTPSTAAALRNAEERQTETRVDPLGDPLPAGAISRLGTARLRHGFWLTFLTFTPDGKWLIAKGNDGVSVWDPVTGKERWRLDRDVRPFVRGTMDLSPDGKRLAEAPVGAPGPIQFWDVDSGKKIGSLGTRFRPPIRFSPDGKLLAAAVSDREFELWDVAGKKMLRSFTDPTVQVWSFTFFPDSRKLLSSNTMGEVRIWDTASGRQLREIKPLSWDPRTSSYRHNLIPLLSADGAFVAIPEVPAPQFITQTPIDPKARVSIWDAASGKLVRQLAVPSPATSPGFVPWFHALTLAADGKRLATTGPDDFLRIWDPASGKELRRLALDSRFNLLAFSKDCNTLAVNTGPTIRILDAASGKDKHASDGHLMSVSVAVLSPDGRTAVTGGNDKFLLVWDAAAGLVRRRLQGDEQGFFTLQLSSDGKTLFSCGWNKILRIWDLESGKEQRRMKLDLGDVNSASRLLVSGDGKTLIVLSPKDTIRVLDTASGEEKRHFHLDKLDGIAMSLDSHTLAGWSGRNRMLHVWDLATGRRRRDVPLPPIENALPKYEVAFSPEGRLLAIGTWHLIGAEGPKEHCLLLTDLDTGQDVYRFDKLPGGVDRLTFSPDGRILAWGCFNEPVIRLLETATGRERRRLTGFRGAVSALHFSADSERLISGSTDTTALIWDLARRFDPHKPSAALTEAKLASLWTDLASDDAARADRAIRALAASPSSAVPFLRKHLSPTLAVEEKHLARLIVDLDSDDFAVRQKSTEELEKYGEQPLSAYQKALEGKPSLELRRRLEELRDTAQRAWWDTSTERLRPLRAVEALELAGTPEVREMLKALAAGSTRSRLTNEAKAALHRLAKRGGN